MKIVKFILPLLILGLGVGGFMHFNSSTKTPEQLERTVRVPIVDAGVIEKQTVSPTLTLYGQVETPNLSTLTASIEADVQQVLVLEGQSVNKGQLLIVMDRRDSELELVQRRAEVAEIEAQIDSDHTRHAADQQALEIEKALLAITAKEVARARTLAQSSAGTQATLDTALKDEQRQQLAITQRHQSIGDFAPRQRLWKARLDKARAALRRTQQDIGRSRIVAPFSGRIVEVMVSPGDRRARGGPLVQLYDDQQLEIRAQVPSQQIRHLRTALENHQRIHARILESGIPLTLDRLSSHIAEGQGGLDAFFRSDQPLPELGRTVSLLLSLPEIDNAVLVGLNALYGNRQVYLIEEGTLHSREIGLLGQRQDKTGTFLILDGTDFQAGELILQSRLPQATDGLEVGVDGLEAQ